MGTLIYDDNQNLDRALIAFVEDHINRLEKLGEDNNAAADDLRTFVAEFKNGHGKFIRFDHWGEALDAAEWHGWPLDNIEREIGANRKSEGVQPDKDREPDDPLAYFEPEDYDSLEQGAFEYLRNQGYMCWVAGEGLRYA